MGLMYTFSMWASRALEWLMAHVWKPFLAVALLLLPFGRKRSICDHHRPSMWLGLRHCLGLQRECHGDCISSEEHNWDSFVDNMSWSLYTLDLMVWAYVFSLTLYCVAPTAASSISIDI